MSQLSEFKNNLKAELIPPLAYNLIKFTNKSYRLQVEGWEQVENALAAGESIVFSSWHGKSWVPAYFLRDLGIYALTSLSRDGSYMAEILHRLGWKTVRGSSSRGASRSLLSLYRKLKEGASTALTPDGPTGPIYEIKPGIIFLQEKANSMLVPMGVDARWKKNFASWDKYLLPLPFSKTALVFGEPFRFEAGMEMEAKQKILKSKMEKVNLRAAEIVKK
ncbi:MAG: lysophospholipid acyltransferase family protein [Halanaerobium sp.]